MKLFRRPRPPRRIPQQITVTTEPEDLDLSARDRAALRRYQKRTYDQNQNPRRIRGRNDDDVTDLLDMRGRHDEATRRRRMLAARDPICWICEAPATWVTRYPPPAPHESYVCDEHYMAGKNTGRAICGHCGGTYGDCGCWFEPTARRWVAWENAAVTQRIVA
jgi:hypothetical protein